MARTIFITGATDGIGRRAAKLLSEAGHTLLLHGRSSRKLDETAVEIGGATERYEADLSKMSEVIGMADALRKAHDRIDVIINNAGVYKTPHTQTEDGLDVRFMVNTIAPYALTRALLPLVPKDGRIVNLSSAAQAPVDERALSGDVRLDDMGAYAQSKLGITIWSRALAQELPEGPAVIAVNPGSLLATKMVREGFGVAGNDLDIGADIIHRLAVDPAFADASGKYFDNDIGRFGAPHSAAMNAEHAKSVMTALERLTQRLC